MTATGAARQRQESWQLLKGKKMDGAEPAGAHVKYPVAVMRRSDLSFGARTLYGILLSYAWDDPQCFPLVDTLCQDMGKSQNMVTAYARELVAAGLLQVKRRGRGQSNIYRVAPGPITPLPRKQEPQNTVTLEPQDSAVLPAEPGQEPQYLAVLEPQDIVTPLEEDVDTDLLQTKTPADAGDAVASTAATPDPSTAAQRPATRAPKRSAAAATKRAVARSPVAASHVSHVSPDAARVADVWMFVNRQPPATAHADTIAEYQQQAEALIACRLPPDDLIGCIRYVASMFAKQGKPWRVTDRIIRDRIGWWQEKPGRPTTYTPPPPDQNGQRASPVGPQFDRDPTPNAPPDAVMCWCNTIEGYRHGRGCNLKGLVTKDNYRDPGDWTIRHTPAGVVRDPLPDDGGGT